MKKIDKFNFKIFDKKNQQMINADYENGNYIALFKEDTSEKLFAIHILLDDKNLEKRDKGLPFTIDINDDSSVKWFNSDEFDLYVEETKENEIENNFVEITQTKVEQFQKIGLVHTYFTNLASLFYHELDLEIKQKNPNSFLIVLYKQMLDNLNVDGDKPLDEDFSLDIQEEFYTKIRKLKVENSITNEEYDRLIETFEIPFESYICIVKEYQEWKENG